MASLGARYTLDASNRSLLLSLSIDVVFVTLSKSAVDCNDSVYISFVTNLSLFLQRNKI